MTIELARSAFTGARPRVLLLVHSYRKLAGVELHVHTLARGLRDRYQFGIAYPVNEQVHFPENNQNDLPGATLAPDIHFRAEHDGGLVQMAGSFAPN